jgi:hypothetical protein
MKVEGTNCIVAGTCLWRFQSRAYAESFRIVARSNPCVSRRGEQRCSGGKASHRQKIATRNPIRFNLLHSGSPFELECDPSADVVLQEFAGHTRGIAADVSKSIAALIEPTNACRTTVLMSSFSASGTGKLRAGFQY